MPRANRALSAFCRPCGFTGANDYGRWTVYKGAPKIALAVANAADLPKLKRLRAWISKHWYPRYNMSDIPCRTMKEYVVRYPV